MRQGADRWGAESFFRAEMESHVLNLSSKLVFCSAQSFLQATKKLVLFALGKREILVSQLTVFLFQFALYFVSSSPSFVAS